MCKNVAVFQICFLLLSSQIWLETRGWITGDAAGKTLCKCGEKWRESVPGPGVRSGGVDSVDTV